MALMRLDRFFSSQGLLSRKEVRPLLKTGSIAINGEPAKLPDQQLDPERDEVTLYGERVNYREHIYLMLNKPQGYVSSTEDSRSPTVLELVSPELRRRGLFPAGRLDKDSTGFVLLTDNGSFAHRILSPKNHVEKEYEVGLDAPLDERGIARMTEGVTLADGTFCRCVRLNILTPGREPVVQIVLDEGKYHQIKRMFGVLGLGVNSLKRVRIGGLWLDENLAEGEYKEILHKEVENILVI